MNEKKRKCCEWAESQENYPEDIFGSSQEEIVIQKKYQVEYMPLVKSFFVDLENLHLSDNELKAIPSLFLPSCGRNYPKSQRKIAVIGESSLEWNDTLYCDLQRYKNESYWSDDYGFLSSFYHFQNEDEGPVKWRDNFWNYHAKVLEHLYSIENSFIRSNPVFSQTAWGNCWPLEPYRKNTTGVRINDISPCNYSAILEIAKKYRINGLEHFIAVFSPDIIIYTCKNRNPPCCCPSDWIFPQNETVCLPVSQPKFPIVALQYKSTLIIQTWHPSYLRRKKVFELEFSDSVIQAIRELRADLLPIK